MELLTIDRDKCKQDGWCAKVCPAGLIRMSKKDGYPALVARGELAWMACIRCGHCVSVCPHGALDHAEIRREQCAPIQKQLRIGRDQAVQFLRARRSIRAFLDRPVEKETLQQLVEIARYAPTASNAQDLVWMVWTKKDSIRQCAEWTMAWMKDLVATQPHVKYASYLPAMVKAWDKGIDVVLRGAPALVLVAAPKENRNGLVDVTCALSYLQLAAPPMGLGTCWAGLLQAAMAGWPEFARHYPLLTTHPHFYPMMVGYTDVRYYRLPERKPPQIQWVD